MWSQLNEADFLSEGILPFNFCEYYKGIYGGACPILNSQLKHFKELGITRIITLTEFPLSAPFFENGNESYKPEPLVTDISLSHFPINDGSMPNKLTLENIISLMINELKQGKVYIHCWRGNGRTRTVIGSYLRLVEKINIFPVIEKIDDANAEKIKEGKIAKQSLTYQQNEFLNQLSITSYILNPKALFSIPSRNPMYDYLSRGTKANSVEASMRKKITSDNSELLLGSFSDLFPDLEYNFEQAVSDLLLAEKPPIIVYGKKMNQNRDVGFFSNESEGYFYSGQLMPSQPLTPLLNQLLSAINERFTTTWSTRKYNGILINRYNSGENYISAHSDDETSLGENGVIAISLGATRKFRIRAKNEKQKFNLHCYKEEKFYEEHHSQKEKEIVDDILLENKSVVWMAGNFQKEFTHEIPKEKKIKESRISLTFRCHLK